MSSRFLCRNSGIFRFQLRRFHHHRSALNHHPFLGSLRIHPQKHSAFSFCSRPPIPTDSDADSDSKSKPESEESDAEDSSEWEYRSVDSEDVRQRNYQVLSWRTVLATILVFGAGTIVFQQRLHSHRQKQKQPQYASYGEAMIGGADTEWKMTDHHGNAVDHTTLRGAFQIVYFGFTFCPDVCPRELTKMATALSLLEERGYSVPGDVQPVFVSVDPKRDTPELVKAYIRQFHPAIYGLTGSPEQVAKFAKAYKAYFSTPGPGENMEDYIIDHVTMMYVMGRQGEYVGHISTLENAHEMADKIAGMLKAQGHSGGFLGKWFKDPSQLIAKPKAQT